MTLSALCGPLKASRKRLGAAVVEIRVFVVDAAERGRIVAAIGIVALFEADLVDLAVGELGAAVAGVAGGLGGAKHVLAALGGRREPAVGRAERVPGIIERVQIGDQGFDILGLGLACPACSW